MNNPNGGPLDDEEFIDPLADDAASPEVEAIIAERDEYRDRFMRALADAENARKRADKERRDAEQYGGSRLARDLLCNELIQRFRVKSRAQTGGKVPVCGSGAAPTFRGASVTNGVAGASSSKGFDWSA